MNIKNKIKENKVDILIWFCYTIFILFIAIGFHEKWRDEAQAWLLARDLNLIDLLKQMSYEGHPPLWHIILMPFAKLGFPYITESIISCVIMSITAWLILRKSPFKKSTQILLLLTAPFIYLYPAISRSYCLVALALVLIAIFYKDRRQKKMQYVLSILLLAYSHVIMLGVVGILYLLFFVEEIFYVKKDKKETKELLISLAVVIVGLLFLFVLLFGSITKNEVVTFSGIDSLNSTKINKLIYDIYINMFGNLAYSFGFRIVLVIFAIALIIIEGKKKPENMLIAIVGILWQIFIYLFIWGAIAQRINTILLIGIFIAWIGKEQNIEKKVTKNSINISRTIEIGCLMILVFSVMQGITLLNEEINKQYSCAKEAAQYINQNLKDDAIIVCTDSALASALIPYTENIKFWSPATEKYFTFVTWDKNAKEELSMEEIINKAKENFENDKNVYLLNCHNEKIEKGTSIDTFQNDNILSEAIYESNKKNCCTEEIYSIYALQF